ncbi:MAG TPA: hypothetical protein VLY63_08170, partial [Anaerolineae bacterium]|nr:hypothetical protein [Anaerolineae bacterium]
MSRKNAYWLLVLFLVASMLFTACGPTAAPEEPTAAPVEPTAAPEEPTQVPETGEDKLLIAGVVFQSDTFMQTVQAGIEAAAAEAGAEVILGNT